MTNKNKGRRTAALATGAFAAFLAAGAYFWLARAAVPEWMDGRPGSNQDSTQGSAKGTGQGAAPGTAPTPAGRAGAVPLVSVAAAQRRDVAIQVQANGTVVPLSSVEIRPHVSRLVRQVHVTEGQTVAAGALLFSLDDRAERALVDQARARLLRNEAALADLERQYKRSQELAAQRFISPSAAEALQTQVEGQRAQVQADQAALRSAGVELSYSSLRAPSAGRIGSINVYPGSTVQVNAVLASVTQMDPIGISFTVPESGLAGLLQGQRDGTAEVSATLPEPARTLRGKLSFIDSAVDSVAGTIRAKAQFANAAAQLWPGQYVQTTVTLGRLRSAVVVPLAAIVTGASGSRVYAVDGGQLAQARPVNVLHTFGALAAVSGLDAGERVIVEGKQNLRPGVKVKVARGAETVDAVAAVPDADAGAERVR
ncbi:efflux RND transporter periplasmic adaptor subunit [Pseudoduganella sp. LjRoot289]|uniref:efflux RND transporter periplasmic adaptor subunit n=1 Tax=Pseudoduganella sp. LjRoot289 TaxID=3342314 RepID=UPI003ECC4CA5